MVGRYNVTNEAIDAKTGTVLELGSMSGYG